MNVEIKGENDILWRNLGLMNDGNGGQKWQNIEIGDDVMEYGTKNVCTQKCDEFKMSDENGVRIWKMDNFMYRTNQVPTLDTPDWSHTQLNARTLWANVLS